MPVAAWMARLRGMAARAAAKPLPHVAPAVNADLTAPLRVARAVARVGVIIPVNIEFLP